MFRYKQAAVIGLMGSLAIPTQAALVEADFTSSNFRLSSPNLIISGEYFDGTTLHQFNLGHDNTNILAVNPIAHTPSLNLFTGFNQSVSGSFSYDSETALSYFGGATGRSRGSSTTSLNANVYDPLAAASAGINSVTGTIYLNNNRNEHSGSVDTFEIYGAINNITPLLTESSGVSLSVDLTDSMHTTSYMSELSGWANSSASDFFSSASTELLAQLQNASLSTPSLEYQVNFSYLSLRDNTGTVFNTAAELPSTLDPAAFDSSSWFGIFTTASGSALQNNNHLDHTTLVEIASNLSNIIDSIPEYLIPIPSTRPSFHPSTEIWDLQSQLANRHPDVLLSFNPETGERIPGAEPSQASIDALVAEVRTLSPDTIPFLREWILDRLPADLIQAGFDAWSSPELSSADIIAGLPREFAGMLPASLLAEVMMQQPQLAMYLAPAALTNLINELSPEAVINLAHEAVYFIESTINNGIQLTPEGEQLLSSLREIAEFGYLTTTGPALFEDITTGQYVQINSIRSNINFMYDAIELTQVTSTLSTGEIISAYENSGTLPSEEIPGVFELPNNIRVNEGAGTITVTNNDGSETEFHIGDTFLFDETPVEQNQAVVFDPWVAVGYEYEITGGDAGMFFASIQVPVVGGDSEFAIRVYNPNTGEYMDPVTLLAGEIFDFTTLGFDVAKFIIDGINPSEMLDPENPLAFPALIAFTGTGLVSIGQTALTLWVDEPGQPNNTVPEPGTWLLMLLGSAMLLGRNIRLRSYKLV